jgi:hypothetical protein
MLEAWGFGPTSLDRARMDRACFNRIIPADAGCIGRGVGFPATRSTRYTPQL